MAKFRLGNEVRERCYWKEEKEKKCRMCGFERKTWEDVWEDCVGWSGLGRSW